MKRSKKLLPTFILVAGMALTGCNEADVFVPPPPAPPAPPPPPPPTTQSQFGAGFESAFDADRFAEPVDPQAGFIIDLDITADPVDIPDPEQ